jgi:gelsolin
VSLSSISIYYHETTIHTQANYGGAFHNDAKERKAQAEAEYKGAGSKAGIEVWRIENFGVKELQPPFGQFFERDSYIVLSTTEKEEGGKKLYNLHFWL